MAADLLTEQQRVLWKLYDQHGGVGFMADDELEDWAGACRTLMDSSGSRAAPAQQARALWGLRLAEAQAEQDQRRAAAAD
jgi:hypothetical protein